MNGEQLFYNRPTFPAQLDMSHPLTRGLVGCWVLNDPSGMRAWDSSPYQNHGLVTGAQGRWRGRTFDGDDLINLDAVVASLAAATQGTIEFWAKMPDVTPAAIQALISFGDTQAPIEVLTIWQGTTGKPLFYCQDEGVVEWAVQIDVAPFTDNVWFHIAGVQGGTSPILYINGAVPAQTFTTDVNRTTWFSALTNIDNGRLGCYNINGVGNSNFLTGTIGEVRIYNRALTAAEVMNLFLNPYDMFLR